MVKAPSTEDWNSIPWGWEPIVHGEFDGCRGNQVLMERMGEK